MFKFTTTTIINDSNGFRALKDESDNITALQINHGILIKKSEKANYVAYMTQPSDAVNAVCVLDLTSLTIAAGDIYRLALYVKLSGSQNSYYSNDLAFKGKPLYVEAKAASSSATDLANAIVANAKKYQQMVYENQLVTITADSGEITITATDEYQRLLNEQKKNMEVVVLEYPYIFGAMEARLPIWRDIFLDRYVNGKNPVFFSKGSTTMTSIDLGNCPTGVLSGGS